MKKRKFAGGALALALALLLTLGLFPQFPVEAALKNVEGMKISYQLDGVTSVPKGMPFGATFYFTFDDNVTASNLSSYSRIIYYEGYRVFRFMSLSSDKYVIDEENNTIDVGGDSDSNILSNIAVSFDDAVVNIQDDTLYVYYNDELLKSFNLLRVVNPKTGSLCIYLILGLLVISLGIIFYLRKRKKYISG